MIIAAGATHCRRPECGGTIIDWSDGARCLLCGRGPAEAAGTANDFYLADLAAMMQAPPGSRPSARSCIDESEYQRPKRPGAPSRKWLAWEGYDGDAVDVRTPNDGRRGPWDGSRRRAILELEAAGYTAREIAAEGARRAQVGEEGWTRQWVGIVLRGVGRV